ncbi:MAG: hypothetical protein ACP5HQ_01335 [Thermoprotei archaeon]
MSDRPGSQNEQDKKTVTIRGIDRKLYEMAAETARKTGKTVGEVVNESLRLFFSATGKLSEIADETVAKLAGLKESFESGLRESKGEVQVISNVDEISVRRAELESLGKKVSFQNVKRLVLEDLTDEDIEKYIHSIVNVDEVVVPKGVNRLKLLTKGRLIRKVTTM